MCKNLIGEVVCAHLSPYEIPEKRCFPNLSLNLKFLSVLLSDSDE